MAHSNDSADFRKLINDHINTVRGGDRAVLIRDEDHRTFDTQKRNYDYNQHVLGTSIQSASTRRVNRPLRYYITLSDPALSIYLNDAKEKARASHVQGIRNWFQEWYVGPAFVSAKRWGRLVLIRITPADNFMFEFATSGNPIKTYTAVQGAIAFESYRGLHVQVKAGMVLGALVTDAVISTQKRSVNGSGNDTSINKRQYQVELVHEPVAYTTPQEAINRKRFPYGLYESWAPGIPFSGVMLRTTQQGEGGWSANRSSLMHHALRDKGFDVPFLDSANLDPVRTAYIRTSADWPRAMGKQVVEDKTYGTREFVIYVDAFNQFHVFPSAAIKPLNVVNPYLQNVPDIYVTRLAPTLPSWCYVQPGKAIDRPLGTINSDWLTDAPDPDWKFNHLGTRAAAIFYERAEWLYDSATLAGAPSVGASNPFTQTDFDNFKATLGIQSRHNVSFNAGHNEKRYFVAPGVIEIAFQIDITGFELNEYVATATVREVRRPTTSKFCSLAVGYVWYDAPFDAKVVKDKQGKIIKDERIVKAGDFVSFDIEWYYNIIDSYAQLIRVSSIKRIDTAKDTGTITEVEVMCPYPTILLALDIPTFSWVENAYDEVYTKRMAALKVGDPNYPGTREIDWISPTVGAAVIIGGKFKELTFPEKVLPETKKRVTEYYKSIYTGDPLVFRKRLDTFFREHQNWVFMELRDPTDWGTGNFNQWRLAQLYRRHAIVGSYPDPPDAEAISRYCLGATYSYIPPIHCYYSASFKFAWYTYAELICTNYDADPDTTFYVHPSGTWAFFHNTLIFLSDGMPYIGDYVNTLDAFDPEKTIEHVIFDRVHLEMKTNGMSLGKFDTTFRELYNRAVKAGKKAKTLEDGIEEIALKDLRGTFKKEIVVPFPTDPTFNDMTWLDLKLTWNGVDYWYPESGIQGGGYHLTTAPTGWQGGLVGMTLNYAWFSGAGYTGYVAFPALDTKHIRFCNAIVLQTKL